LDRTSLRLQNAWGFGAGAYPIRNLQVGFHYNQDSWRYDWLGFPAGTTIPYIKGTQWSRTGFIRYTPDIGKFHLALEGGGGQAQVDFAQGTEAFLADHNSALLARPSGTTFPFSGELSYNWLNPKEGESGHIGPFVRYDYAITNLDGSTKVHKRELVFGLLLQMF
jgi:hypothetical protein